MQDEVLGSREYCEAPPRDLKKKRPSPLTRKVGSLTRCGWLSNQHGAWAMMVVPLFVGSYLGGFSWWQALLTAAWFAAFFSFNTFGLWVKVSASARKRAQMQHRGEGKPLLSEAQKKSVRSRQSRFVPPMVTYASVAAVLAAVILVAHPGLVVWAPAFSVCVAVAVWEMWEGRERSFLARASAIVASGLLTPIAFSLGTDPHDAARMWVASAVLILYFIGTIPYVKTLIRERNNPVWLRFSLGYHAALLALAAALSVTGVLSWWVTLLWVVLLARAALFPYWSKRSGPLKPPVIGFSEFAFSAMVVAAVLAPPLLT